jgi:hypothetical protein
MSKRNVLPVSVLITICLFLTIPGRDLLAQWPQAPQQSYPQQQYPPSQPQYPPTQPQYPPSQPQYPPPGQQQYSPQPPMTSQSAAQPSGQTFNDALGRFKVTLPQGTMPIGATYNFGIPSAMCQVSISSMTQDQMFQMQMQNFPNMMRQMGANVDHEQATEVKGKQARFIAATMKDQASGMSMHLMSVFISGANMWVQVMGPEQNVQQLQQTLQSILAGLQF